MARGAEIYRKIEDAYIACEWAEVSRLAKKYRRRSELSEEWECILEGMAGVWRAVDRSVSLQGGLGRFSCKDRHGRLGLMRIDKAVLQDTAAGVGNAKVREEHTGSLVQAVQAVVMTLLGECQKAVSLFNATGIASITSNPVAHLLFSPAGARANSANEMPLVECLVAVQCMLFKGFALEGIQEGALAVDQYNAIADLYNRATSTPEAGSADLKALKLVLLECMYRRAMLVKVGPAAAYLKFAFRMERKEDMHYHAVRKLLLCERWLEVMPVVYRRHSLRVALDASEAADLVAENLEEERVWTCEAMIDCLRLVYEKDRQLFNDQRDLVERLNNAIIKNLALGSAFYLLIDFLKTGVYARMPVGRAYYTHLFLALMSAPGYNLTEAYLAGDILLKKYAGEVDASVKGVFLNCCYRLGLFDRVIDEAAALPDSRSSITLLHAKSLIHRARQCRHSAAVFKQAEALLARCTCAESRYLAAVCFYELRNIEAALDSIQMARELHPGESKYALYHALLLSSKKDYPECMRELERLWAEHPVHSIDLTLAKARCEQALGRPFAAIDTLASRLSYNIAQAAAVAASTTIFSGSDRNEATSVAVLSGDRAHSLASAGDNSEGALSRAAGFLSEPAVDILQHKIVASHVPADLQGAVEEFQHAFPKDPIDFRAERLEHGLHVPTDVLPKEHRLAAVEREEYSELVLLLELTHVYLNTPGQEDEVAYCMQCIKRLDNLLPHLYYLQGLQSSNSHEQQRLFEKSIEYGACLEGLLAVAELNITNGNAAYSKMLLSRLTSNDYRIPLLLGRSCMQLGQVEEAGEHIVRAMALEEYSLLYVPNLL